MTGEDTEEVELEAGDDQERQEDAVAVHELQELEAAGSGVEEAAEEADDAEDGEDDLLGEDGSSEARLEVVDEVHRGLQRAHLGVDSDEEKGEVKEDEPETREG